MPQQSGLNILHVEDNPVEQEIIKVVFSDCHVTTVDTEAAAILELQSQQFDVVLLDLQLAEGDGFNLTQRIRAETYNSAVPLIIVSGKKETSDKVLALQIGADDYLTKPINYLEIKARVHAVCRRYSMAQKTQTGPIHRGPFLLDSQKFNLKIFVDRKESTFDLTGIEYKLMRFFLDNLDQIVTREKILETVWGSDVHVIDRTVDAKISGLRKKLGPYSDCLKSIYGVGYRLSTPDSEKALTP